MPTKKKKLTQRGRLSAQFVRAAEFVEVNGTWGCSATLQVGGPRLVGVFCAIMKPRNYNANPLWMGDGILEDDGTDVWPPMNFTERFDYRQQQRVIALLLCAEYVLTMEVLP